MLYEVITVVAFFDSTPIRKKNKLMGLTIYKIKELNYLIERHDITHVVFAKRDTTEKEKEYIAGICMQHDIQMLTIPDSWLEGNMNTNDLKELNVEDVLNRKRNNFV